MIANTKLVTIGHFDLKLNHLLIIGILSLSFTVSFLLRAQPADFGFELNEFDPFFNYRATQYIVDNGILAYYEWHDDLSWYPHGRDVARSAQIALHVTAAITYWMFGAGMDLYDFTIIFPAVFGALSSIVIFALVRVIGGTTAGLFAALLFSTALPILIRGPIGWFKSEPFGLFLAILAIYLLLSGIHTSNRKIVFAKLIGAGFFTSFAISAWGGNLFFMIVVSLFFITLPFLRSDHKFLITTIPFYTAIVFLTTFAFPRVVDGFTFGLGGIALMVSTAFLVACIFIQNKSSKNKTRNGLLFLLVLLIAVPATLLVNAESQFLPSTSHRYLNALNPFLTTTNPLVDSVSEHGTTTPGQSFLFHSSLMVFAGIGVWLVIKNIQSKTYSLFKNDMMAFSLILGFVGVYLSSTFVRLETFGSVSVVLLASLGLALLAKHFFTKNPESRQLPSMPLQLSFVAGVTVLLMIPFVYPVNSEVSALVDIPPTILTGATAYPVITNDWLNALDWIKNNTPKDAVFASWWDYGYWIATMGERATLADNSTTHTRIIENIARIFFLDPDTAWVALNEAQTDYFLIFIAGENLSHDANNPLYILGGGGDESKKQWFARIAGHDPTKYLYADGVSATDTFHHDTMLGQMTPFSLLVYVNPRDFNQQSDTYIPGMAGLYAKDIKYPADGDGPFRIVYASPSFVSEQTGPMHGIFIYEINKDYQPFS